jgi:hypothetical protein
MQDRGILGVLLDDDWNDGRLLQHLGKPAQ